MEIARICMILMVADKDYTQPNFALDAVVFTTLKTVS
jgi:hypothetical protein